MKINVRLLIGESDVEFEDLNEEVQEKYRRKITGIYAEQVLNRVIEMIRQNKSEDEIKSYLLLDRDDTKTHISNIDRNVSNLYSVDSKLNNALKNTG
ncbi:MAG: hypothetical protein PWQ37_2877 [Candidatus Petromonas sp.]|jgi:hypothetical protein|nr:hypothetical protein [Candidatus Petromonas sp.]